MSDAEDDINLVDLQQRSENNILIVPLQFKTNKFILDEEALLDSGASGEYVDPSFVKRYNLPQFRLKNSLKIRNADGSVNTNCTLYTKIHINVNNKWTTIFPKIITLGKYRLFLGITWLRKHNPIINWKDKTLSWEDEYQNKLKLKEVKSDEINQIYHSINFKANTSQQLHNSTTKPKKESDPKIAVPKKFHKYLKVFNKEESEKLPPRRPWDHKIDLDPDFVPKRMPVYNLTPKEREELDKFISENLRKGYIRKSQAPMASSFFFVGKKGGDLRPCQDYRYLNQKTVKNAHPIPNISRIMDKLKGSKWFTKMDIRLGYNNIRIREGDEWKAAFRTPNGLYEPTVMFFGMTNSPATFQSMMDHIFSDLVMKGGVIIYMDDILIHAITKQQLDELTKKVLQVLLDNQLYLKVEKCEFETQ